MSITTATAVTAAAPPPPSADTISAMHEMSAVTTAMHDMSVDNVEATNAEERAGVQRTAQQQQQSGANGERDDPVPS
eukprot:CAMPEP_0178660358 /NCGR_PEP_ID=MMETSP0698-20121128/27085_1 /TAXON_ID=265572 /ORGANISM="Extubocellulus spinifer, Strain CCMP396" /LENGTH=76 /DNA_ID=CAMNT_0020303015 /DNA_START=20 /DNA_END=247 /DNA_ORIENTATION=-